MRATATRFLGLLVAAALVGVGSWIFQREAWRIASLASVDARPPSVSAGHQGFAVV